MRKPVTYKQAGVDIETQDRLLASLARKIPGIGGFSGIFPLVQRSAFSIQRYKEPCLVASTDGVGTKLLVALEAGRLRTVGIDLVAMVVNDLVCCGARPLFLLDYYATGQLRAEQWEAALEGIVEGCRQADCVLLGGETAEMPGLYARGHFDMAGFGVGLVERARIVDGSKIAVGDVVIGLASSGLHSNGYSLARKILFKRRKMRLSDRLEGETEDLATVLLRPTRIYTRVGLALCEAGKVHGLAHITGGGLPDNIRRLLPDSTAVEIDAGSWPVPNIFAQLARLGPVERDEMFHTFNMGIGLVVIVRPRDVERALAICRERGETAHVIGKVVSGPREVSIR
ncbi:phosphoribosylformylglycinamidine cyclo-ligase [Candidatus Sumerlaeota bacterium]|nr:phosphoribosylformylglycinamidine cyclo-ligase [Candidatus Sumerlaeota bacterium]